MKQSIRDNQNNQDNKDNQDNQVLIQVVQTQIQIKTPTMSYFFHDFFSEFAYDLIKCWFIEFPNETTD